LILTGSLIFRAVIETPPGKSRRLGHIFRRVDKKQGMFTQGNIVDRLSSRDTPFLYSAHVSGATHPTQ
jgi:hypothetical protein